jgi:hypothetical protein
MPRTSAIVAHLSGRPYLRADMLSPKFRWRLNVDEARAAADGLAFCDADSDGYFIKVSESDPSDRHQLPLPLEFCRVGTNFQDESGQVHLLSLDFDGSNHGDGHSPEQLERIINALKRVEWCHIYRSRSGQGYHVFIPLGRPIRTDVNDGAVAALGNRMVQILADEIGEPELDTYVDKAGSIMYLSAPEAAPNGFQLIKSADTVYPGDVQPLYRGGKFTADPAAFDNQHGQLLEWLKVNAQCDVKQDGPFLKVHTTDIARAHQALKLRGSFTTSSTGGQDRKPNAWMVPQENGQWLIGRFGKHEPNWPTHNGHSYYILNPFLDLEDYIEVVGGNVWTKEEAERFCAEIGCTFPDPGTNPAGIVVARTKDGITFTIAVKPTQAIGAGWRKISERKAQFFIRRPSKASNPQETLRVCYNHGGKGTILYRRLHGNRWHQVAVDDAKMYLESYLGLDKLDIGRILTTDRPIEMVNEPFADEWIGSYKWNHNAVQLAFEPAQEPGEYPHWQMILNHIGGGLDQAVSQDEWCRANGIKSGARYLMYWDARVIRAPKSRLPMLCLYSPQQNCGKSIQFSKFNLLVTGSGYALAENALTTDFNLDLKNAIIADLDDVSISSQAAKKLLPFLTNDSIKIVGKGKDSIQVDNSTHWGHTANHVDSFWIPMGDQRTVAIEVGELVAEVPRETMDRCLLSEAPFYLRALFDLPMPEPASRLYLPVIDTPLKRRIMLANSPTTVEQAEWVNRLQALAEDGKLHDFTADDLVKLWPDAPGTHTLRSNWAKLSMILENRGYRTGHSLNQKGGKPARYSIIDSRAELA